MLNEFLHNLTHSLFKPLLLFFYAGFLIPLFRVKFEFPKAVYQGLTIYLLLSIGWHGGKELAMLPISSLGQALGLCAIGFVTNTVIGLTAFGALRAFTKLRRVDAATVAGYYGSDSAGTFVTTLGVLATAQIAFAPYMPVMLAIMEIPGCIVALVLVSRMRNQGMDANGNMPGEIGYAPAKRRLSKVTKIVEEEAAEWQPSSESEEYATNANGHGGTAVAKFVRVPGRVGGGQGGDDGESWKGEDEAQQLMDRLEAEELEAKLSLESDQPTHKNSTARGSKRSTAWISRSTLHEVFFNPGIFLLFAGIAIGFISRLQGEKVTAADDALFDHLFQGVLCLFLLEMGMTAASKLKDLKSAGWQFVAFGLIAPNVFATLGMCILHGYSLFLGEPFQVGTYVLFGVLCGSASYIALPAVQRLAIPEASPTLPLAASLGLTFSYNVTIGIPVYIAIAQKLTAWMPIYAIA